MKPINRFVCCIFIIFFCAGCAQKKDASLDLPTIENASTKINGVSFVAAADSLSARHIVALQTVHPNYVTVMPFGFIKGLNHPEIIYNQKRQWFGETYEGVAQYVNMLHQNGIRVMLKPQIWVWNGEFTGYVEMASEADWLQLEETYKNFILDFAKVAETENIEIFCVGTELEKFIEHRPAFWRELIAEVKTIFNGKVTYAANWDEYKQVPFWDALDYIGVNAYFPISDQKTPTVEETKIGWGRWKTELQTISDKENKKILFTEYGYRSVDLSGKEPWRSDREMTSINLKAQANLLEGLYKSVWNEQWFAGGFLWKWFIANDKVGGARNTQFTPQNKPAQKIIAKYYGP
ncbi:glycoside hydrolase family 113 [Aequorivita marisscotiae]|uniref:Glycoside hydrolase n=1 Tax=Aequorivita marisscotiae TaxID=3040348 RepID=A0ABY8KXU6_9FLAO|nr:glycoside hydrolase [Aequorivita sp. Ant34-E75]WGF93040.1 glycoside hydrolase [Aequorivita sp. Ant34-E75]